MVVGRTYSREHVVLHITRVMFVWKEEKPSFFRLDFHISPSIMQMTYHFPFSFFLLPVSTTETKLERGEVEAKAMYANIRSDFFTELVILRRPGTFVSSYFKNIQRQIFLNSMSYNMSET